jgi:hypothetical protein
MCISYPAHMEDAGTSARKRTRDEMAFNPGNSGKQIMGVHRISRDGQIKD